MSGGFWAWVAGPGGTLAGMSVALVVGTALGWLAHATPRRVSRRERLRLADAAEERAQDRWFAAVRRELPGAAPELHHERRTSTAAFLDPPRPSARPTERIPLEYRPLLDRIEGIGTPIWAPRPRTDEEAARDAWSEHMDQALDVANGDPITTGEIRAITEDMDVFMARLLGEHPVPWPDGSGQ